MPEADSVPVATRTAPLHRHLTRLVWIAIAPLLVLGAVLAALHVRDVRSDLEAEATALARSLAAAVDRGLSSRIRGLSLLAETPELDDPGRWPAFRRVADAYVKAYDAHLILADTSMQMRMNTRVPPGTALQRLPVPRGRAAAPAALATRKPVVGDSFTGPMAGTLLVAIAVPVMRQGEPQALLISTLESARLRPPLDETPRPAGWRVSLRDSTGVVIAGEGGALNELPDEAGLRSRRTLETVPWSVVVEVPAVDAARPLWRAGAALAAAVVLSTLAGLLGSALAARRMERALAALAAGGPPEPAPPRAAGIDEIAAVQQRLDEAGRQREAAERQLRESERNYRLLFDDNPSPMWVFDVATLRFLAVNDAAIARYGYSREEFLAMTIADIRPPEDRERLRAVIDEPAGRTSLRRVGTWVHRLRDGREINVEITSSPTTFGDREARLVMARDVSQQVQMERTLEQRERDFQVLAEQIPAIVYRARLSPPGVTDYVSPRISELGFTPEEWMKKPDRIWSLMHPEDRDRVRAELAAASAGPDAEHHFEYRVRDASGGWRHVSDHARIVRPAGGEAPFVLGVNVDITRTRLAEQALRESEAHRRGLFEAMADAVLVLDPALRVIDANPAATAMLNCQPERLRALALPDLLPAAERDTAAARVAALAASQPPRLAEWTQLRCDGSGFPAEVSARPAGEGRTVLVLRDATERREAQRALVRYQMDLSELTQRLLDQERETARHVAQTLHDHLGQSLAVARLHLDAATAALGGELPASLREECERLGRTLDQAVADVRTVLGELRPPMLEEQGLIAALDNETRSHLFDTAGADVLLEVEDGRLALRWPPEVEYAAFMIAREAVLNARRHAGASLVRIVVDGEAHRLLQLEVIDDGRGIAGDTSEAASGQLGLIGMRERALAIGAQFSVEPETGGGTRVALRWEREPG